MTLDGSFHGRTLATLSASGNAAIKSGFSPMVSRFEHVDFNNIDALGKYAGNAEVVAVMLECIQGEAGH